MVILPNFITIPAGPFIVGSNRYEREMAYKLDEAAYGHSRTRNKRWYENERPRKKMTTHAYDITTTLITNEQYASFINETNYPAPTVSVETWDSYGLIHPFHRTRRHVWEFQSYPIGRAKHPVVLVSYDDAVAYANWFSVAVNQKWQLPSEEQWEKAARGIEGNFFPWGNVYDPTRLNSHDLGPFDTIAVNSYPSGNSIFGLQDGAGQVFE